MMDKKLTHINEDGHAAMVDVSEKRPTTRSATATGAVVFPATVFQTLAQQDFLGKKGSIIQTAIIAGIQGVKRTADLIPLCHQLNLSKVHLDIVPDASRNVLRITCTVSCMERTGVEMEALTGVTVAALTIYDMCKALSHDLTITEVQLEEKTGGKHDFKR
jgi:cyclic pyranopterin monophosphate synthase